MRPYNLFVSHSWTYDDEYARLINLLDRFPRFAFKDYSVPFDYPIYDARNSRELTEAIRRKMTFCDVVILLAGVYSTHSRWINAEIDIALAFVRPKPLVAIEPRGSLRTSQIVKKQADCVVGWNSRSIVAAIRKLSSERQ